MSDILERYMRKTLVNFNLTALAGYFDISFPAAELFELSKLFGIQTILPRKINFNHNTNDGSVSLLDVRKVTSVSEEVPEV